VYECEYGSCGKVKEEESFKEVKEEQMIGVAGEIRRKGAKKKLKKGIGIGRYVEPKNR
jgi:hypothetical protein